MDRAEVEAVVVAALADQTGSNPADVTLETELTDDLGLDSLDAVELLVLLEREVGRVLELDEVSPVTVGDVVEWLMASAPAA